MEKTSRIMEELMKVYIANKFVINTDVFIIIKNYYKYIEVLYKNICDMCVCICND